MRIKFFSLQPSQFIALMNEAGHSTWKARQILKWVYTRCVFSPSAMSDIARTLRQEVSDNFDFDPPEIIATATSKDGSTKFLLRLEDESLIEMVIIPDQRKNTLCISSQVGCTHNCAFCATGSMKLHRNLQTHEIIGQIMLAAKHLQPQTLTNLVFMGMGEPLDNLPNVLDALILIQSDDGLSFSPRRTTISTCGIIPGIRALADSGIRTKLAVSLNSAIDEVREGLMPINRRYPLRDLKNVIAYFRRKTNYRITIEYIMIPDINMGEREVRALRKFVGDLSVKINLIPFNPVPSQSWRAPNSAEIDHFQSQLLDLGCAVTLRRSRGADIAGSCGQLTAQMT